MSNLPKKYFLAILCSGIMAYSHFAVADCSITVKVQNDLSYAIEYGMESSFNLSSVDKQNEKLDAGISRSPIAFRRNSGDFGFTLLFRNTATRDIIGRWEFSAKEHGSVITTPPLYMGNKKASHPSPCRDKGNVYRRQRLL